MPLLGYLAWIIGGPLLALVALATVVVFSLVGPRASHPAS